MNRIFIVIVALAIQSTTFAATLTRGPYLQNGTPTSVVIRWRTDVATDSRVQYGDAPGNLASAVSSALLQTEHELAITGLAPNALVYYSIGSSTETLAGNDASHYFITFPPQGTAASARVWVLGDAGTANASQAAVRDAYYNFTGTKHTDLWLMLGDNAYNTGSDSEYQAAVFNMYPAMLQKSVLFSTLGNHDTAQSTTFSDSYPYFSIFTLPTAAEGGGVPSGTEHYYSVDFGNIHFICLDSMTADRATNGAMANWLRSDLANTLGAWIIAFWHHPPYTKGSHNSDTETQLIEMRQNFNPILEAGGVDLVLCGHSHSYERSFLIDRHYGLSTTFSSTNKIDGGSGRDSTPYVKPAGPTPHKGAVYTVAGSSGQTSGGTLNHPAMFISLNVLGSVVLDVAPDRLDLKFVDSVGAIEDYFTIVKGVAPLPPTGLSATAGNAQVALQWAASSSATSYNVKRALTSGGPYTTIAGTAGTSYTDATAVNGTTYYYVVSAANASGESANSTEVSATPSAPVAPAAPTNLAASSPSKKKIMLTWTQSTSGNITNNKIYRSNTSGGPYSVIATIAAGTSYQNNALTSGRTYYYRVSAVNSSGLESALSNEAFAVAR